MITHRVDSIADAKRIQQQKADTDAIASIVFVTMAESGQLDDTTISEHSVQFAVWQANVSYAVDQIREYAGRLYRCLQAHTSQAGWEPSAAASLWKQIGDPTAEWPEWSQPIGATDAYVLGDKVSHNDKHWICTDVDSNGNNVWEPGVFGWTESDD